MQTIFLCVSFFHAVMVTILTFLLFILYILRNLSRKLNELFFSFLFLDDFFYFFYVACNENVLSSKHSISMNIMVFGEKEKRHQGL